MKKEETSNGRSHHQQTDVWPISEKWQLLKNALDISDKLFWLCPLLASNRPPAYLLWETGGFDAVTPFKIS